MLLKNLQTTSSEPFKKSPSHLNTPPQSQASLYKQLGEEDLLHGLWRRRCRTEDTRAALTLLSAGLLPAAQDVLLDVMRKPWEQDSVHLLPPSKFTPLAYQHGIPVPAWLYGAIKPHGLCMALSIHKLSCVASSMREQD